MPRDGVVKNHGSRGDINCGAGASFNPGMFGGWGNGISVGEDEVRGSLHRVTTSCGDSSIRRAINDVTHESRGANEISVDMNPNVNIYYI